MGSTYDRDAELKAFDTTKTGTKGLVDAGVETVPKIFIHPPDDILENNTHIHSGADLQIPVIDLARVDGMDSNERERIVKEILNATEKWGFFQVINHGIPLDVLEKTLEGIRMFHEQDSKVKKEYYNREYNNKQVVYNSNYDLYKREVANWRDTLTLFNDKTGHLDPEEIPPICRDVMVQHTEEVVKLGNVLLELLALALGLRPDCLKELEIAKGWFSVYHYYPACPQPELVFGTAKHYDSDFLTVVLQDQIGGLQVLYENQWVDVQPIPGALVINIGDILQMVLNDRIKSVCHRVNVQNVGPRVSAAFFFTGLQTSPKIYGPIKELVSEENPAIYREFTLKDFIRNFESRPQGERSFKAFMVDNRK